MEKYLHDEILVFPCDINQFLFHKYFRGWNVFYLSVYHLKQLFTTEMYGRKKYELFFENELQVSAAEPNLFSMLSNSCQALHNLSLPLPPRFLPTFSDFLLSFSWDATGGNNSFCAVYFPLVFKLSEHWVKSGSSFSGRRISYLPPVPLCFIFIRLKSKHERKVVCSDIFTSILKCSITEIKKFPSI